MSAWGSVPKAKPQSISDIITQQAEDAGDDDLQAALRASLADGPPDDAALREALEASKLAGTIIRVAGGSVSPLASSPSPLPASALARLLN